MQRSRLRHENDNVTTQRKDRLNKMASSTIVTLAEQNASLIIDELLSQEEKFDIKRMLAEEEKIHKAGSKEESNQTGGDDGLTGADHSKGRDTTGQTEGGGAKPPTRDPSPESGGQGAKSTKRKHKTGFERMMEDASLDDLNDVLTKISERFSDLERTLEDYQLSLEYSQTEIDSLRKDNLGLRKEIKELKKEEHRNEYHVKDLDDKVEKIETQSRKKNLVFEGIKEVNSNNKENVQQTVYKIFDQMNIDHGIGCDTCYRSGTSGKNRPRPIVVTFLKQSDRDHVFYKRTSLKDSRDYQRVWINEDLAPAARRAKTVVRLIAKQAQEKGIPCRNNKFTVTVGDVKYSENNYNELPSHLSVKNVKQIQIDHKTIAYQSEHAPFSSLYPSKIKIGENEYDTSEQAFQHIRAKTNKRPLLAERILLCRKTYTIKQMGDDIKVNEEWNENEEEIMFSIQLKKFQQNSELADMLIATGDCELVEATPSNKWGAGATLSSNILK